MLDALRGRMSDSARGLRKSVRPDGGYGYMLDGRLQHATVAVVGADGQLRTTCVNDLASATRVLGMDPGAVKR